MSRRLTLTLKYYQELMVQLYLSSLETGISTLGKACG